MLKVKDDALLAELSSVNGQLDEVEKKADSQIAKLEGVCDEAKAKIRAIIVEDFSKTLAPRKELLTKFVEEVPDLIDDSDSKPLGASN